jgi:CO dehydrogenase/acetyl-CoA synthase beta subunit
MNLKDIKKKKLRQQLAYLQTELEETKLVYKESLNKFNKDFANYMTGTGLPENEVHTKIPKDPYEEIQTEIDDETLKNVYRKVAGKTHPDKKDGDEKEFKRANEANKNKDFGQLLEMADEYGIDVPMDDRMMNEVSLQIKAVVDTITNMKSTWAWTWVHIDKSNKNMFKKYILQQLTVE